MTHWNEHAKQWNYVGAPLRPSDSDIEIMTSWVNEMNECIKKPLSVLLLGVTPEIVKLAWPKRTTLYVVDNNWAMLQTVLPGNKASLAIAGCWRALPIVASSMDLVIGDGCYNVMLAKHYDELSREIKRVLTPMGSFITRVFIRPEKNESLENLQNDVMSGLVKNFHVFKWRLAMALHGTLAQGVCLRDIWNSWKNHFKGHQLWPEPTVNTINTYKNVNAYYTFPTLHEVRQKLGAYFSEDSIYFPSYTLGERCPTLRFTHTVIK